MACPFRVQWSLGQPRRANTVQQIGKRDANRAEFMAWLATGVAGILFPLGLAAMGDTIASGGMNYSTVGGERAAMYVIVLEQFIMALIAWLFLLLNFTRRTFALDERRR